MAFRICLTVLTTAVIAQVTARCPAACHCPSTPPLCPAGVSAVLDGCGCCKVCAAQLNQDCSAARPCDHHKGLECNYGNDVSVAWGICRAKSEGRTCEYNGRIYQNGESFRAGCKHQCSCIDGAVGCAPLCDSRLPPASPACPDPRPVRVPGQCCLSVHCHKGTRGLAPRPVPPQQHQPRPHGRPHPQHLDNDLDLADKREEVTSSVWEKERSYKHLATWSRLRKKKCPVQTTNWSQCSRSCGMGVSSRITNKNPQCKPERETRLCTVRPCRTPTHDAKPHKWSTRTATRRPAEPARLPYGECESARLFRPSYCGACARGGCSLPRRTRTAPVTFVCPDGGRFQRSVMFIQSCKCSDDCGLLNEVALPPQHWMHGDTHKFTD